MFWTNALSWEGRDAFTNFSPKSLAFGTSNFRFSNGCKFSNSVVINVDWIVVENIDSE